MILTVIIPTLNGKLLLEESLPYLLNALKNVASYEVIIVDNNSTDETVSFLRQSYPEIQVIQLSKNTGFTGAVNEGIHVARGKYILILNNDCLLNNQTISRMLTFLENNNSLVATQPIVYTKKNEIENIGFILDLYKAKASPVTTLLQAKKFEEYRLKSFDTRYMYGVSATCLLIQKDILKTIGMFDQSFHSYLEDVDLSLRLQRNKYDFSPCLEATCIHYHMSTSSKMEYYKEKQDVKNWIKIIIKNYPVSFILKHFLPLSIERLRNLNGFLKKLIQ